MNAAEAALVIRKGNGIWKPLDSEEAQREWLEYLMRFELFPARAALDDLREHLKWWPAMSEFKAAYMAVVARDEAVGPGGHKLLNGRVERNDEANRALYGGAVEDWVYCWQCGMAVTLMERDITATYRENLGWKHASCPKSGTRPLIPAELRIKRDEYWQKVGVSPSGQGRHS